MINQYRQRVIEGYNGGHNKKQNALKKLKQKFLQNGEIRKRLQRDNGEYFCNKKWEASYQKKNGGLSGAAARTGNLRKYKIIRYKKLWGMQLNKKQFNPFVTMQIEILMYTGTFGKISNKWHEQL